MMISFGKLKKLHINGLPVVWTVYAHGKEPYDVEMSRMLDSVDVEDAVVEMAHSIDREILRQLRRHAAGLPSDVDLVPFSGISFPIKPA